MNAIVGLLLIGCAQCANIFVTSPFGGSHLHSIYEVAVVLADAGHNITFINLEEGALDSYSHPGITGYTVKNNAWKKGGFKEMVVQGLSEVIEQSSEDMLKNTMLHPGIGKAWHTAGEKSALVYSSTEIADILDSVQFDLVLAEKTDFQNLAVIVATRGIPIIAYMPACLPALSISASLEHGNLPMLPNSQPSTVFAKDFHTPPTFAQRFSGMLPLLDVTANPKVAYTTLLEKYGYSSFEEVKSNIKLFLTNDHVAFTFPFLRPPNDIAIGAISLLDKKLNPLPQNIVDFIGSDEKTPVIYIAFGSYVDVESYPWYKIVISAINRMDVKVILKTKEKKNLGSKFLPLSWAPQMDLLSSGKVKLFLSHCGNNGRIETIFYNVPVLCVPLFADQYFDSELIKFKGFGETMLKEDITDEKFVIDKIENMIEKHAIYYTNMKVASDIVKNEPANVKKKLLFYVDYLATYKNLDFLQNSVIQQQSIIEIYNLDILIPFVVAFLLIVVVFMYVFYRLFKCLVCGIYNNISSKRKVE